MKELKLNKATERLFDKIKNSNRPSTLRFEDSWLYILQSCRYNGGALKENDEILFYGFKQDNSGIIISNFFGKNKFLISACEYLQDKYNLPIIYKNVKNEDVAKFVKMGFKTYNESENWDDNSKFDDQTFPQRIFNLKKFSEMKGKEYALLRQEINKANRKYSIQCKEYSMKEDRMKIEKLLRKQDKKVPGGYASQSMFLDFESDNDHESLIYTSKNKIIGFMISDRISKKCCAGSGLVYDTDFSGITLLLCQLMAKELIKKGFKFMNLQGSEHKNLDQWKLKFKPKISLINQHLIFTNKNKPYDKLSSIYNKFLIGLSEETWKKGIMKELKNNDILHGDVLDAGAGTGIGARLMKNQGNFKILSVDSSNKMLTTAKHFSDKILNSNLDSLPNIKKKFDLIVSGFDTLNYLDKKRFKKFIDWCSNHVKKGGFVIFDYSTQKLLHKDWKDKRYSQKFGEDKILWEHKYDNKNKLSNTKITFLKNGSKKWTEKHIQYALSPREITGILNGAGFKKTNQRDLEGSSNLKNSNTLVFSFIKK